MAEPDISDIERRMGGALESLRREFQGLRTGRAATSLLEPITVDAYGARMPINQVATLGAPEPRLLTVTVWDKSLASAVDKAIRESSLGLNPQRDGQLLRIPIPELSEERRRELVKVAHRYTESAKIAVRNVRRDGMEMLRRMEREGDISEDDQRLWSDEVQGITDRYIKLIDDALAQKEQDILQV